MAFEPNDEKINDLERDLYSRDAAPITTRKETQETERAGFIKQQTKDEKLIQYGWKQDDAVLTQDVEEVKERGQKGSFATKIFLASVLFFVVAAGIAAYIILGGFNVISSKNVDVSIQGLVAVEAGETTSFDIIVKNNNNVAIESGTMYVEYPDGTRQATDVTQDLVRDQFVLEPISAGNMFTATVRPVFFGEKDSVKQIKVMLDYKARGSNASFSKEKTFDITIKSSPVVMTVDVPQEVNAGQDITLTLDVASNSNTLIRDLMVRAEYPFGFTFVSATPEPLFDTNVWRIGDLNPSGKHTIKIRGRMDGQNEEERTFRFSTGTKSPTDDKQLAVTYITEQASLAIKKPFISLTLDLGNKSQNKTIVAGERVSGTLFWSNNLPVAINDAVIQVKLSGKALDRSLVSGGFGGYFRSADNTINWDKNSVPQLASIEPGENGQVNFGFAALPSSQQLLSSGRNMDVVATALVTGTRVQSGAPQTIRSEITGTAKVGTNLVINGRSTRTTGPFTNTGPVPPRVDQETQYTVVLNLSNSFNDVANAVLTTQLPPYVRWLGKTSPQSEQVTYDESTRRVSWTVPDLRAGVGYTSASKEVSFQVSLLPSVSQIGNVPELTGMLNVSGTDRFTGATVESSKPALSTRTTGDAGYTNASAEVRP
jgi:hypothetical protein